LTVEFKLVWKPNGKAFVIQFTEGQTVIHDATLGVITNPPTYDWHITNLRNYIKLSSVGLPDKKINDSDMWVRIRRFDEADKAIAKFSPIFRSHKSLFVSLAGQPIAISLRYQLDQLDRRLISKENAAPRHPFGQRGVREIVASLTFVALSWLSVVLRESRLSIRSAYRIDTWRTRRKGRLHRLRVRSILGPLKSLV
jgi:Linear amide C-N hydrolases, choloylglycine hydrolase family